MLGSTPGYVICPHKGWLVEVETTIPQWIFSRA